MAILNQGKASDRQSPVIPVAFQLFNWYFCLCLYSWYQPSALTANLKAHQWGLAQPSLILSCCLDRLLIGILYQWSFFILSRPQASGDPCFWLRCQCYGPHPRRNGAISYVSNKRLKRRNFDLQEFEQPKSLRKPESLLKKKEKASRFLFYFLKVSNAIAYRRQTNMLSWGLAYRKRARKS